MGRRVVCGWFYDAETRPKFTDVGVNELMAAPDHTRTDDRRNMILIARLSAEWEHQRTDDASACVLYCTHTHTSLGVSGAAARVTVRHTKETNIATNDATHARTCNRTHARQMPNRINVAIVTRIDHERTNEVDGNDDQSVSNEMNSCAIMR